MESKKVRVEFSVPVSPNADEVRRMTFEERITELRNRRRTPKTCYCAGCQNARRFESTKMVEWAETMSVESPTSHRGWKIVRRVHLTVVS